MLPEPPDPTEALGTVPVEDGARIEASPALPTADDVEATPVSPDEGVVAGFGATDTDPDPGAAPELPFADVRPVVTDEAFSDGETFPRGADGAADEVIAGPARAAPRTVSETHLRGIVESLVFAADKPLTPGEIARIARAETKDVRRILEALREDYRGRGIQLDEIAGGWQFRSAAVNAPFVRELLQARPVKLTRAQIETLAIVAYRQPITRPEVDEIRGVDSGSALKVLLERELLRILGRKEDVGRPVLYGTSHQFLEFFGLRSLKDLPTLREFTELTPESEATLSRELGPDGVAPDAPAGTEVPADPPPPPGVGLPPAESAEVDSADTHPLADDEPSE